MKPFLRFIPSILLMFSLCAAVPMAGAEKLPPVWGYGIQSCQAFVAAADGRDQGVDLQNWEYRRYQDWLTGFVTGLNLATGQDVLVGVGVDSALKRIQAHCLGNGKEDFLTAAMDLVRMLSGLR
jgi:hypothetical protein